MNTQIARERTIIFIDGNNFYHGMRSIGLPPGINFDYEAFSKKLVGAHEWAGTRYYIGQIRQAGNFALYAEQRKLLAHLAKSPRMQVFLGRMEPRPAKNRYKTKLRRWLRTLPSRNDVTVPQQIVEELTGIANTADRLIWTEKAVDVMIATDIVSMAYEEQYDTAYLVSADGDFTPAVKKARATGRKVFAASPQYGHQLAQAANGFISMKEREFFHGCWR